MDGTTRYWIPGRLEPHATIPVPPNGSTKVKPDANLMFLGGYQAKKHTVFLDESRETLQKQAELKDDS